MNCSILIINFFLINYGAANNDIQTNTQAVLTIYTVSNSYPNALPSYEDATNPSPPSYDDPMVVKTYEHTVELNIVPSSSFVNEPESNNGIDNNMQNQSNKCCYSYFKVLFFLMTIATIGFSFFCLTKHL